MLRENLRNVSESLFGTIILRSKLFVSSMEKLYGPIILLETIVKHGVAISVVGRPCANLVHCVYEQNSIVKSCPLGQPVFNS